jgi:AraC-like DNA-binding protein
LRRDLNPTVGFRLRHRSGSESLGGAEADPPFLALLTQPGPGVLQVALAVGFDSAGAFSRAFHRRFGELPAAYRPRVLGGG